MTRVTKEVLKDVENQLHDLMVSVDALTVLVEKLLGMDDDELVAAIEEESK